MNCGRCGNKTSGTWSEGGHCWSLCESCMDLETRLRGPPDDDVSTEDPYEFSESEDGEEARHNWARRYDELEGAPEGDWDR